MRSFRTKLAAAVFMGLAATALATSTATAETADPPTARITEIGGLGNLNGFCRAAGWDYSKPLDPNDAFSWVCVREATGEVAYIDLDNACVWHHPAYPDAWAGTTNPGDAFSLRCYIG
ncbi:hypothetical protein [Actinophytocola oryzae]|uniref:Beta/gamma crystallin n=1 Tax=Actinophytocola oryzae TaxID=502181 RepID=A0A4R7VHB5_9PSEU|nr:hypothetical protein [Actinophytocola oryzae]TDV48733.1 hypothetical protein CLV71_10893 [Actinophytocola oryzae]